MRDPHAHLARKMKGMRRQSVRQPVDDPRTEELKGEMRQVDASYLRSGIVEGWSPASATGEQRVPHQLGKVPRGILVVRSDVPVVPYATEEQRERWTRDEVVVELATFAPHAITTETSIDWVVI